MARIGWAPCGVCGNPEASVTKNDHGTVSLRCHKCEFSGFAKAGTKSARHIESVMVPDQDAQPAAPKSAPGAKPAAKAPAPIPAKPASSVFSLGDL